ncbi:MAG: hypothetical protein M1830_002450 [Pleopsidium flavum]|nr:MAG: hypothetical protein M1830_002450 [Pleopsidium flavum]
MTDFDFLRTCSQIYQEARLLIFKSHTFTFDREKVLHLFTKDQQMAMGGLKLYFRVNRPGSLLGNWMCMCKAVGKHLTGLRNLQLCIRVMTWTAGNFHDFRKKLLDGRQEWMEGINVLRGMNLAKVQGQLCVRFYKAGVSNAYFIIDFHDLDSLIEAFTETQERRVRELYKL